MALNSKQQMFIDSYLQCFNATKAALDAGYSEKSAHAIGWENLRKPEIKEVVSQRLSDTAMSPEEVIRRLGEHARGTVSPFLVQRENDNNISIDLTTPHAKANLHLIKKISQKHTIRSGRDNEEIEDITLSIEMYDAQSALNTLAKHHGLLTEKTEITGKDGEAIQVKFVDYRAGLNGTSEA